MNKEKKKKRKDIFRYTVHLQDADLIRIILFLGGEEFHHIMRMNRAVEDSEIGDDTAERVEHGIENEGLQRRIGIAFRGGDAFNDSLQDFLHALPRLTRLLSY